MLSRHRTGFAFGAATVFAGAAALAGWGLGGTSGLWTACLVLLVLLLVATRLVLVRPPRTLHLAPPADIARTDITHSPGYRRASEALSWSDVSRRLFDHVTRPVLVRLAGARLIAAFGIDPRRDPERAAKLLGAELWPLVDPATPVSDDGSAPGESVAGIERLVRRLEEL